MFNSLKLKETQTRRGTEKQKVWPHTLHFSIHDFIKLQSKWVQQSIEVRKTENECFGRPGNKILLFFIDSKCFFPAKVLIVQHALKHGGIKQKNLLFISES